MNTPRTNAVEQHVRAAHEPIDAVADVLAFARALETELAAWKAEAMQSRSKLGALRTEIKDARVELAAMRHTVVFTIGGTVEGAPTQEINYLQRLRELLRKEAELEHIKS